MRNLKLYPYKMGSESAKELARLLEIKRINPTGRYVPRIGHRIINWGSSRNPDWNNTASRRGVRILNTVAAVNTASNKLSAFQALQRGRVSVPEFTTEMAVAQRWLRNGETVVERHELRGNSAAGIRIVNSDDDDMESDIRRAPLYTKFVSKNREFRVHVFNGQVIDYIEKKRRNKDQRPANFNKYICSNDYGWVFCRQNIKHIPEVKQEAIKAVKALGLDFAAVDVIYCDGVPFVLEANTAPGIMGTTLGKYVNAFRGFMGAPDLTFDIDDDEEVNVVDEVIAPPTRVREPAVNAFNRPARTLDRTPRANDDVTFTLDRPTARKIIALLETGLR